MRDRLEATLTQRLYYSDSHLFSFSARVTACAPADGQWAISLDKTAFFPEGGGQSADTGYIGSARVTAVHERAGDIIHYASAPLEVGCEYECVLDKEQRLRRMQNHTGEHILSGLAHSLYGVENVGFHMGAECMTIDFDRELSWEELLRVEALANEAVREDLPVRAWFPDAAELAGCDYRSKLALTENVRLVEILGVDICACCAPHVSRTGEVGLIKLLELARHRGGVRLSAVCGMDALDAVRVMQDNVTEASRLLSARRGETAAAVERLLSQQQQLKERIAQLSMANARMRADMTAPCAGNICVFDNTLDEVALRELANLLAEKCGGYAAVFSGSDEAGWRYTLVSRRVDLRAASRAINSAIGGRGGGTPEMLRGSAAKSRKEIQDYIENT